MSLRGAIFDLDGVIVDTVPLHFKAWKKMFAEYGHDFTMEDYLKKVDGRPRLDGAGAVLSGLSAAELTKAGDKKQRYYLELIQKEPIRIFDSSVKLIRQMRKAGIKIAVASSSKNTVEVLEKTGLKALFDAIVSGGDFKKGKPDPEIFLLAAKKLALSPQECVVFEDAKAGVEAARRGGFYGIGIDRHDNPADLKAADKIVGDLSGLKIDDIVSAVEGQ